MSSRPLLITASILSCNLARLQEEVESIEHHADWLQVDVMDGHFVPHLTFGAPLVRCLKTGLPLDIHLMVTNPGDRLREFIDLGAKSITFHAEAVEGTADRMRIIEETQTAGLLSGVAINPATPISAIEDVLNNVDLVLVMSVEPGRSGQPFLAEVLEKVRHLRGRFPDLMIQMDGGITGDVAPLCREAGADTLVSASYIFGASNRAEAIATLRGA